MTSYEREVLYQLKERVLKLEEIIKQKPKPLILIKMSKSATMEQQNGAMASLEVKMPEYHFLLFPVLEIGQGAEVAVLYSEQELGKVFFDDLQKTVWDFLPKQDRMLTTMLYHGAIRDLLAVYKRYSSSDEFDYLGFQELEKRPDMAKAIENANYYDVLVSEEERSPYLSDLHSDWSGNEKLSENYIPYLDEKPEGMYKQEAEAEEQRKDIYTENEPLC